VHAELTRAGWHCGRKRVARLMRLHHQVGAHPTPLAHRTG
jgi:hypothetical protein